MNQTMQFDAIAETIPGEKWLGRWNRCWPAYKQWFMERGGDQGPSRVECENALSQYMPELLPTWKSLCTLSGEDDLAARFLSTWCPPAYLGGCSLAALTDSGTTRLVRNYDLSPDLNEGLLLRTEWTGTKVMGMIEFLWGLSDGVNEHGLTVALAFGGSRRVAKGFGITTILRYIMETCSTVDQALNVLGRVPSHMAYNIALADASGTNVVTEIKPGGGMRVMKTAVSTNHQHGSSTPDKAALTQTFERFAHLEQVVSSGIKPEKLADEFLKSPLFQVNYAESMGTLFTAEYDPVSRSLNLRWPSLNWPQSLENFQERTQHITFASTTDSYNRDSYTQSPSTTDAQWLDQFQSIEQYTTNKATFVDWMKQAKSGNVNWKKFSDAFTQRYNG